MYETVNFGLPKLTKPKKKFKNTIKCHNSFTIPLFLVIIAISLISYYFIIFVIIL